MTPLTRSRLVAFVLLVTPSILLLRAAVISHAAAQRSAAALPPPLPPPRRRPALTFTYEQGDVIGGFAVKVALAMNRLGVAVTVRPHWQGADYFWHTSYRPNQWTPHGLRRAQNVFYNPENTRVDASHGETILQTRLLEADQLHSTRIFHVPWAWVAFEHRYHMPNASYLLRDRSNFDAAKVSKSKKRFCAFLASLCVYDHGYLQLYGSGIKGVKLERTGFYELLNSTYKPIDALGRCHHNREQPPIPAELRAHYPEWSAHDSFIYMVRDYKFVMSFENMATPGYFTEKLFNAYLGQAVPIYWGDPNVDALVNTEAFIWCRKDRQGSWQTCINRIIELDNDPVKYQHMLAQPILKDNRVPDWMSFEVLSRKLLAAWGVEHAKG